MCAVKIKKFIGTSFPRALSIWRIVRISRGRFSFSGWGMYTDSSTTPPWMTLIEGAEVDSAIGFKQTDLTLKSLLDDKRFILSQFTHLPLQSSALEALAWRHYIVYWTALSAAKATRAGTKNLVEAGTCDGLTAYFAMTAMRNLGVEYKCYMYDAWEAMRSDNLMESEESKSGMYGYLDLKITTKNLNDFAEAAVYNRGYIPNSFSTFVNPEEIVWLHIDLNAAVPTRSSLEYFYDKVLPGGIILLDDYAFHDHMETKKIVDTFFSQRNVNLLQLPTGQGIVFKN